MLTGKEKYPENVSERLTEVVHNIVVINAAEIAKELGNIKAQNVVLLGALIKVLKLESIDWNQVISAIVPEKAIDINKKAFKAGIDVQ